MIVREPHDIPLKIPVSELLFVEVLFQISVHHFVVKLSENGAYSGATCRIYVVK